MGWGSMKARRQCGHGRKVTLGFELVLVELEAMVEVALIEIEDLSLDGGREEMGGGINKQGL
jgi:hypothetical protein